MVYSGNTLKDPDNAGKILDENSAKYGKHIPKSYPGEPQEPPESVWDLPGTHRSEENSKSQSM